MLIHLITKIIFSNFVVGCIFQPALVHCISVYSDQLLGARHTLIYLITIKGTLDQLCKVGPLNRYSTSYSRLINLVQGSFTTGVLNYPVIWRGPSHVKLEMHVRRCTSISGHSHSNICIKDQSFIDSIDNNVIRYATDWKMSITVVYIGHWQSCTQRDQFVIPSKGSFINGIMQVGGGGIELCDTQ